MELQERFKALPRQRRGLVIYTGAALVIGLVYFVIGMMSPPVGTGALMSGVHLFNFISMPLLMLGLVFFGLWELRLLRWK